MSPIDTNQYFVKQEPFYEPQGREVALFSATYAARLPEQLPMLYLVLTC